MFFFFGTNCLVPIKAILCLYKEFHIGKAQKLATTVEGDEKILLDDGLGVTQAVNARGISPYQTPQSWWVSNFSSRNSKMESCDHLPGIVQA